MPTKQPVFRTRFGEIIDPLKLRPSQVKIEDIAYHLAGINRFNGGTRWTVAEHSVIVSRIAETINASIGIGPRETRKEMSEDLKLLAAMIGLIHDGPEYITGDFTRAIKSMIYLESENEFGARTSLPISLVEMENFKSIALALLSDFAPIHRDQLGIDCVGEYVNWCDEWLNEIEATYRQNTNLTASSILATLPVLRRQFPEHLIEVILDYLAFPKSPLEAEHLFLRRFHELKEKGK